MKINLTILFFILFQLTFAQFYTSLTIPEELQKDAYAVVRKEEISVNVLAPNKIEQKIDYVITVVDKSGVQFAQPVQFYDPNIKINSLEAVFYDAVGNVIKKFKEKDFFDQSYISDGQMYTDSRVKYLDFVPTRYPYTLHFKAEVTHSSTWIMSWAPIKSNHIGIETSSYTLHNPKNLKIHSKELNLKEYGILSQNPTQGNLQYEIKNVKPSKEEDMLPIYSSIYPNVEFSLQEFQIDGVKGSFSNWSEMGKWYNQLLTNAHDLSPSQKAFFQNLVKEAKTDKEKVQILYKYMQGKTRYIGVQLGIGGLKPFPASYVESKSYGDCKALTNYMQAILDAVGITSYFTVVQAGRKREDLHTDFASIAQGNHIILYVPLKEEDIWLETTNQQIAFNYLGNFTDNRNVLAIYPEGGKLIKTPKYSFEKNTEVTKGIFEISYDGKLAGKITSEFAGIQYNWMYPLHFKNSKEQKKSLLENYDNLPNLNIKDYAFTNNWEEAIFTMNVDLESPQFGKIFGNNMTINVVPAGVENSNLKKSTNRKHPFEIGFGNSDELEFEIKFPSNYQVDGNFEPLNLDTEFGTYTLTVSQHSKNSVLVKRTLTIKEGIYSSEKFNDYVEFRRKIASFDNSKLLLEKI